MTPVLALPACSLTSLLPNASVHWSLISGHTSSLPDAALVQHGALAASAAGTHHAQAGAPPTPRTYQCTHARVHTQQAGAPLMHAACHLLVLRSPSIYVHVYICIYMYMYACVYTCIHVCCGSARIQLSIDDIRAIKGAFDHYAATGTATRVHVCMCVYMCICIHIYSEPSGSATCESHQAFVQSQHGHLVLYVYTHSLTDRADEIYTYALCQQGSTRQSRVT